MFEDREAQYGNLWSGQPLSPSEPRFVFSAEGEVESVFVLAEAEICSDGMSDRKYPLSVKVQIRRDEEKTNLSGCCSLQSR